MKRLTHTLLLCSLVCGTLIVLTACNSRLTGNEGNLTFQYNADDDVNNFNKPVAVGAKLDVKALEVGTNRAVTLTEAGTKDKDVLDVATFSGNTFTLEGKGAGNTLVELTATTPGGDEVTDSINMSAAVPDVLKMSHTCTTDAEALYLVNRPLLLVGFDMERSNGQPVIGYGYYPVTVEPAEAMTLLSDHKDQVFMHFSSGATKGDFTFTSTLGDNATLKASLVEEGDIDGISTNKDINPLPWEIRVGNVNFPHVWATVGDKRICQSDLRSTMSVENKTPEICDVGVAGQDIDESLAGETQFLRIEGKSVGVCEFTLTFSSAMGGAGVSTDLTASIGDFPDDTADETGGDDSEDETSTASTAGE